MNPTPRTLTFVAPVFRVTQLSRTIAYYREKLGFDLEFCYEGFYASVCREGCHVHLQCASPTPRDQLAFERAEHIDACFVVQAIEGLWTSIASVGAATTVPLRKMPYGKEFYIRDPDGYILGFIEPVASEGESNA